MKFDTEVFVESCQSKAYAGDLRTYNKGYLGLGDPDEKTLSDIEVKAVIPAWERDIIIRDYCNNENQEYETCRSCTYFYNRFYICSERKSNLSNCVEHWKSRLNLKEQATAEYLEERRLYRSTGLTKIEREKGIDAKEGMATVLVNKLRSFILKKEEMKHYEENVKSK